MSRIKQEKNVICPGENEEPILDAATGVILYEMVFLEISQNSQERTCVRVSFLIRLQASGLQLY